MLLWHVHAGGTVAHSYLLNTLLTNNAICLAGIALTVIGLQASVGEWPVLALNLSVM